MMTQVVSSLMSEASRLEGLEDWLNSVANCMTVVLFGNCRWP